MPLMGGWSNALWGTPKSYIAAFLQHILICLFIAISVLYFGIQSSKADKLKSSCHLCSQGGGKEEDSPSALHHIKTRHNIFKFIGCFRYVLSKPQEALTLQETRIRQLLLARNTDIFN
jgi:hypothetical protein